MSQHTVLDKTAHRDLRVRPDCGAELGDAVMATLTVPNEFRSVQGHFPILFRREPGRDGFMALALFGFENGENLFLEGDRWNARYRPWSLAIQPFLVGRPASGEGAAQVHVDMAHPRISKDGEGVRLFEAEGIATPYLEAVAERLGALDEGYRASGDFFAALADHDLLEPFTLEVPLGDGSKHSLVGFHIIDEAKLAALDGETVAKLHAAGHLMPIFMAIASLSQFSALVERKNRRAGHG